MLDSCRQYYRGNRQVLKQIDEFEENYHKDDCFQWYTRETFLYKIINKILRTEDIEQLFIFRYYIIDLSSQLSKECEKIKSGSEKSIHLYRGTTITTETAETFKVNQGKLIATNCYWSTSRDRSYALTFAKRSHNRPDVIPVLFKIECDVEDPNNVAIFADISAFSNFPEEQEVLFDVGTVFKIEIVKEEKLEDNDILLVVIKTTGEGQDITANYMEVNRREMQEESPKIMLCNLLKKIGKFEKSLKFLKQLQRNPGDENLAHIHNRIGIALKDEKKYEAALEHFQTAFELAYNSEPPQRKYSAFILHNQGLVYAKQNKLNEALRFQQRAMEIVESIGSTNSHFVASYYGSIGRIFSRQKDFDKAMKYFMEAIKISEMSLSTDHVYNAFNFANIATMYARQHKYDEALSYHLMALELRKKYLPSNNYNLGWSLEEVARMYYKKGDSQKALEYYLESLKIARSYTFPSWQHNLIRLLDNIALVYGSGYEKALEYHLQALEMQRKFEPTNYRTLIKHLEKIASTYKCIGDMYNSLKYFKEISAIYEKYLSYDRNNMAQHFNTMASVYEQMNELYYALNYYSKAKHIYEELCSYDTLFYENIKQSIKRVKDSIRRRSNRSLCSSNIVGESKALNSDKE
ncbi:unnamed protein product [Rotaria sp. Silwood2]|nr:unnamed protein product [Rotaria sp. Silwood2]